MPTPTLRVRPVAPVLLCACLLALTSALFAPDAEARGKSSLAADLRVVDSDNRTLTEGTQLTGPVRVKTDPEADCFGPGTGGSGDRVRIAATTALGQLANGGSRLGLTDHFDFGLGLCRIGSAISPPTGFWYLKVDHEASTVGGDQTKIHRGDDVLWFLIEDFNDPTPDELELEAPATAKPGRPFEVEVTSWNGEGRQSPAAGVSVTGADAPTDAAGKTTVSVSSRTAELRATGAGAIGSNTEVVCTERLRDCPAGYGTTIAGTKRADSITGGRGAERIVAGARRDRIDVRRGRAPDRINCGRGKDRLTISRKSASRYRSCERVKRRR